MIDSITDIPRTLCASASQCDSYWTSHIVLFDPTEEDIASLLRECEEYWSPGLVVVLRAIAIPNHSLQGIAGSLALLAARMGKARRITSFTPVNSEMASHLYLSFHCVEFMDQNGNTRIVDDGNEKVVEVRISNSL